MLFLFWPALKTSYFPKLYGMDIAYHGAPFVQGPDPTSTNLNNMDIAYQGQPFVRYAK